MSFCSNKLQSTWLLVLNHEQIQPLKKKKATTKKEAKKISPKIKWGLLKLIYFAIMV